MNGPDVGGFWSQHGGTVITAALTFCGGVGAALLALFAKRSSNPAELLTARTSAWRELMLQSESVISRLTARNDELEERLEETNDLLGDARRDNLSLRDENLQLLGEVRQRDQKISSLLTLLGRVEGSTSDDQFKRGDN